MKIRPSSQTFFAHLSMCVLKSLLERVCVSVCVWWDADTARAFVAVRSIWQREQNQSDNCPCLALSGPIRGPVG